jgi:hypothetical protein
MNGEAVDASLEATLAIEQFLTDRYRFRRNVLNGKVEFATLLKAEPPADSLSQGSEEARLVFRSLTPEAFNSIVRRAKKELIVVDAYPGVATLDMLAKRGRGVKIELVTHSNGELEESDYEAFGAQCGKFTKTICGICHDRFIIVDQKEIFWTGASLKDAGRLTFAAAKMGAEVIPGLLESIRKATSERREYGKGKKTRGLGAKTSPKSRK